MRWLAFLLALVGACYRTGTDRACEIRCDTLDPVCPSNFACSPNGFCTAGQQCADDGGVIDIDAAIDADPSATDCLGGPPGLVPTICFPPTLPPLTLDQEGIIETDGVVCAQVVQQGARQICVVAGNPLQVTAKLRVVGSRPLVLWSFSGITVTQGAALDASSSATAVGGGSQLACALSVMTEGVNSDTGGGGGAGGTFNGIGGNGGAGAGGGGGVAQSPGVPAVTELHGGCPGSRGGNGFVANAGVGGQGGGAIYLLAKDMISVFGTINASGSGGGKPGDGAGGGGGGGGGGGSGGVIGLEAPTLTFGATTDVFALGGGGAGGAISLEPGRPSDEAEGATLPADPAGQTADFNSGGGGSAINNGNIGGDTAITNAGGGGGGGASGFIFLFGNGTQLGTFAPPPT